MSDQLFCMSTQCHTSRGGWWLADSSSLSIHPGGSAYTSSPHTSFAVDHIGHLWIMGNKGMSASSLSFLTILDWLFFLSGLFVASTSQLLQMVCISPPWFIFFPHLTSWQSRVTRRPSLAMPSSFRSFRWGHSARQNALAIRSVSRLCSAESLAPLLGFWLRWRKKTCRDRITRPIKGRRGSDGFSQNPDQNLLLLSSEWSSRFLCIQIFGTSWCCWWTPWTFHRWGWWRWTDVTDKRLLLPPKD